MSDCSNWRGDRIKAAVEHQSEILQYGDVCSLTTFVLG